VTVRVRLADLGEVSDVDALVSLRRAWAAEQQREQPLHDAASDERFRDWLAAEASRRRFWLAEHAPSDGGAAPIGMLGLLEYHRMPKPGRPPSGWGYVGNLFVLEPHLAPASPTRRTCSFSRCPDARRPPDVT
jgi:hypothetical protein